jgi:hypothetical protein
MRPVPFALCLGVFLSAPAIGVAQPAPAKASTDALTDQARELHVKGAGLYDQGQYDKAEAAFLAAWALKKHYQIAANLGACEVKLGKYRDAAEHLAFFLREQPQGGNQDERQRTRALFDEVRPKVGAVTIKVDMPGTIVTVDGREVGTAPLPAEVYVEPGRRTIEAVRAGDPGARAVVDVGAGETREVTLALKKKDGPPPPLPPSGPTSSLTPQGGPKTAVLVTGGAVTGVALVLGAAFAAVSNGKASSAASMNETLVRTGGPRACMTAGPAAGCADLVGVLKDRATFAGAALSSFVGAGAVGAATAIYALAALSSATRANVRATPVVTGQGAGLILHGVW